MLLQAYLQLTDIVGTSTLPFYQTNIQAEMEEPCLQLTVSINHQYRRQCVNNTVVMRRCHGGRCSQGTCTAQLMFTQLK